MKTFAVKLIGAGAAGYSIGLDRLAGSRGRAIRPISKSALGRRRISRGNLSESHSVTNNGE